MCSPYIIYSPSIDCYYTGISNDVQALLKRHNQKGKKYTTRGIPCTLKYTETFSTKQEALARERFLKKQKSRRLLEEFIQSNLAT